MDLSTLLAAALGARGDQTALESGATTWSYADLDRVTRQRAAVLRAADQDLARVVLAGEHTADALIWAVAIMRAGLTYTPVNPGLPAERLREALQVAAPGLVICEAAVAESLRDSGHTVVTSGDLAGRPAPADVPATWPVGEIAYSIFTSGSSGLPKLVNVGHRGIENLCRAQTRLFGLEPGHRVPQFSSLAFDASVAELLVSLYAGATLVVPEWDGGSWVTAVGAYLAANDCDVLTVPPSVYARLTDKARKAIGTVVFAGEALSEVEFETAIRHSRVLNAYGPTEGTVCFSVTTPIRYTISVGRPIDGYTALVHDSRHGAYREAGRGELVLVGDGVALGYEGRDGGPFTTVDGRPAYHTGDDVELHDGEVFYVGRVDDQIKRLGHRIALTDLEGRLSRLLGVRVAVFTEGSSLVLAYTEADRSEADLKTWLRDVLPAWEVPDLLLSIPELPVTHTGKVDKDTLRTLVQLNSQLVEGGAHGDDRTIVSGIVAEVLGAEIDPATSVFDAGGDSFALVQIQVKLVERYGEDAVLDAFDQLDYDFTIDGFVAALGGDTREEPSPAQTVFRAVSAELSALPSAFADLRPAGAAPPGAVTVTGASGFIGGHLLDRLLGTGRAITVVTTSNPRRLVDRHCTRFDRDPSEYDTVRFLSYEDLDQSDAEPWGVVLHCGYEVNHVLPLERQVRGSVATTAAVVRAAAARGARRFVFLSTASAGEEFVPFTEDALAAIGDPYSQSKFIAETYAETLESAGCNVDLLRVGLVYGHSARETAFLDDDVFANLLRFSARHGILPRLSGLVPVCHVADITDAALTAADSSGAGARSVLVQRTYGVDDLCAELGEARLVEPKEWLTTVTEAGGEDTRVLAALRLWLSEEGWREPVRTTDRPIIRELGLTLRS